MSTTTMTKPYDPAMDYNDRSRRDDLLAPMDAYRTFAATHDLYASHAEFTHGSATVKMYDFELDDWRATLPSIVLPCLETGEFLRWAEALMAPFLQVERRELDFIVAVPTIARDGFDWYANTSVHRFDSRMAGSGVKWARHSGRLSNGGSVSVAGFRTWLAGHGYRFADGTPVAAV